MLWIYRKEEKMETDEGNLETSLSLKDEVKRLSSLKLSTKPKSFALVLGNGGELRVATNLINNTIQLYSVQTTQKDCEAKSLRFISNQGHRSEVRAVAFSSDNIAICTGSGDSVKLWNRSTQVCLRTINTG